MLITNASYHKLLTGLAKSSPERFVVRFSLDYFQSNLEYAFLQSSKDFIN